MVYGWVVAHVVQLRAHVRRHAVYLLLVVQQILSHQLTTLLNLIEVVHFPERIGGGFLSHSLLGVFHLHIIFDWDVWTIWIVRIFSVDFECVEGKEPLRRWSYIHQVVVVIVYRVRCDERTLHKRRRGLGHPSHAARFLLTTEDL